MHQNPLPTLIPARLNTALRRLKKLCWERLATLEVEAAPITEHATSPVEARKQDFQPLAQSSLLGRHADRFKHRWVRAQLPTDAMGHEVAFFWNARGESTVYLDDVPWAGLDIAHPYCWLPAGTGEVYLDVGLWQINICFPGQHPDRAGLRYEEAYLASRNETAWHAMLDFEALVGVADHLLGQGKLAARRERQAPGTVDTLSPLGRRLLRDLDRAVDLLDQQQLDAFAEHLKELRTQLPAEAWQPEATLVGHSHLDLLWRWPERVTIHKGVHTLATALRLMERYPEFIYQHSSPWLFEQIKLREPKLFEQIQQRVREGRFELTGGMWTEADCHLPCGEALARGMVYAQRWYREIRGEYSRLLWMPDTFGFCACLPQIMQQARLPYFQTTKMAWSKVTRFPWQSFRWRSADGSEVLAHFSGSWPELQPGTLADAAARYTQADVHDAFLCPLGAGDGGGGANEHDPERARRHADLAQTPRARWRTSEAFFDALAQVREQLPEYSGELYLEFHRAIFTTQSEFKRLYRRAEMALQAHEAVRALIGGAALGIAHWDRVLLAQFHDALPGTSIRDVYAEMNPELEQFAQQELSDAARELDDAGTAHDCPGPVVFNPLPLRRTVVAELPADAVDEDHLSAMRCGETEAPLPLQIAGEGDSRRVLAGLEMQPLSAIRLNTGATPAGQPAYRWSVSEQALDNGLIRARFDASGNLVGFRVDVEEILLDGAAGFQLYPDHPHVYDAWDIDHQSLRLGRPAAEDLKLKVVEQGPVRAVLRGECDIGLRSHMAVSYILEYGSDWLKVELDVDWQEDHMLLKYHIPTQYRTAPVRYGEPFGSILRTQQPQQAREEAMWEVPGSRWVALGDEGLDGGLAVATEAKYGFLCRDGELTISLLRAPSEPDPQADRGHHCIRFALSRHQASTGQGRLSTAAAADALYAPVLLCRRQPPPPRFRLQSKGSLVPVWVLPSETETGTVIRLHETAGRRGSAAIERTRKELQVTRVNLLEEHISDLPQTGENRFRIDYEPYQVISLMLR